MQSGRQSPAREGMPLALVRLLVPLTVILATPGCGDLDGDGYTIEQGDCDDADPSINPFAREVCDGVDQDCDGKVDEGLTITYYPDADGDGYGVEAGSLELCGASPGYASNADDCDDGSADIHPGAIELCNGIDDDCDTAVDEGATTRYYEDADGDGYGSPDASVDACSPPDQYVASGDDCDDADPAVHPWAVDEPNGTDDDCNGVVDDLFIAVAAGEAHSLVLRSDGTVWAWGSNAHGQLGDGTTTDSAQPVQVTGLEDAVAIAAGFDHSLALRRVGSTTEVVAWGGNADGQLGNDSITDAPELVAVNLAGVVSVVAGAYHTLAIVSATGEREAWSWGDNSEGQLGNGTLEDSTVPVQVKTVSDVTVLAAGDYHSFAIESGGDVYAWGRNDDGQLGDGSITRRISPTLIDISTPLVAIAAGFGHSVGLDGDGGLYVWGVYDEDEDTGTTGVALRPTALETPGGLLMVAAGSYHSAAADAEGVTWTWGENDAGQLGDGTTTSDWVPAERPDLSLVTALAAGARHTLALTSGGDIWTWGANNHGQLGDWTTEDRSSPVQVRW